MTEPMYVSASFPWELLGFKKFTFKEKELFETHLAQMEGIMSSYLCFSSLIMWDDWTRVYYMEEGSYLCLLLEEGPTDEWGIMPPLGPWDREHQEELFHVFKKMERMFHENHLPFSCCELKEPMLPFVEQMDLEWKIWYARENSDYIFTIDDFCASFQNARARYNIRYLEKRGVIRAESAGAEELAVYEGLLKRHFCDCHSCSGCDQGCELGAMRAVLALGENAGMETFLVWDGDVPVGYAGVARVGNCMIFQILKCERGRRGLLEWIHREAVERYGKGILYVNYTEDMGKPGLRKHKREIGPHRLSHNYVCETYPQG